MATEVVGGALGPDDMCVRTLFTCLCVHVRVCACAHTCTCAGAG